MSHFNVSLIVEGQSHDQAVSINHNVEEKGQQKRTQSDVCPSIALPLDQTSSQGIRTHLVLLTPAESQLQGQVGSLMTVYTFVFVGNTLPDPGGVLAV